MKVFNVELLMEEAEELLMQINNQIEEVIEDAEARDVNPHQMKYINGQYVLPLLLEAKAKTLLAITQLNML